MVIRSSSFLQVKLSQEHLTFFKKINLFLFLAELGLCCCTRAFSSCGEWGLLSVAVRGLLIAVASLVGEHGLQACGPQQLRHAGSVVVARGLQSTGSAVVVHGLSCSAACRILPDQDSKLCPLHWQVDSQPLCHQGRPTSYLYNVHWSESGEQRKFRCPWRMLLAVPFLK